MRFGLSFRKNFLFFGDILFFFLALIISLLIGFGKDFNLQVFLQHLVPFSILFFLWFFFFAIEGGYNLYTLKNTLSLFGKVVFLFIFIIVSSSLFFYFLKNFQITPKQNLINFSLIFCILVFSWRNLALFLYSKRFRYKMVILGVNPSSEKLANQLIKNPQLGWHFEGFTDEKNLKKIIKSKDKIDFNLLLLAKKFEIDKEKENLFFDLISHKVDILNLDEAYETIFQRIPVEFIDYSWFINNLKEGKKELYDRTKRVLDILIAGLVLITTLFLWLPIAIAIKLEDRGPIFYKQKRVGKDKVIFYLLKFRSMVPNAEKNGPLWAKKDDPRTTKVGKILRRTHLDELPQMINVLKGDISLIGPRPERPEFVKKLEKEIPYYHLRHIIKPGFTGWAQVKFRYARSVIDSLEKFEYDLYYIKNRSLLLDIYILLKTFGLFFRG